jgi:dCTP deaminase
MFLSDLQIKEALNAGDITIKDFDEKRLQPASYDILLGNKFILTESHATQFIDPAKGIFPQTREVTVEDGDFFVLHPNVSILGTSWDFFGAKSDYLIQLSGKSSLARIGLIVHNTAGLINPGHYLNITLELCNLNNVPIILRPKMEIAQLLFSRLAGKVSQDYTEVGRYNEDNWTGIVPPKKKK